MSLVNTLQIYEFCRTFASQLNLRTRYTVEQLHDSFESNENSSLAYQLVIGLIDKFCLAYLVQASTQTNSAFLNVIGQIKNQFIRRSILMNIWPTIFTLITRIYRIRAYIKDEIELEYQQFKEHLQQEQFKNWLAIDKQKLILFMMVTIFYESEFLILEIDQRIKIQEILSNNDWKKEFAKKEAEVKRLQQSVGKVAKKKQKEQVKTLQIIAGLEEELNLYTKASTVVNSQLFYNSAVEKISDNIYVFQEEKRCIYQENNEEDWQVIKGAEMIELIGQQQKKSAQMKTLVSEGYFSLEECKLDPIVLDNTYGIEQISQDSMAIELFQRCDINTVRQILLALEKDYSEYELIYWKSCWTSAEKRKIWQEKVQNADMVELTEILSKIPHQLSWVNKKHGQTDSQAKYKSSRLYWFYQNKLYSMPYQQLSKQEPSLHSMYLLAITLYDKLKSYIHRKMRTMDINQIQQQQQQSDLESTLDDDFQDLK
ncbi:unnamed protein product (macronuclear) [Paramecium tetraurelia]|uniref:Chromosome undetermined scaffold_1, whole genome shotgun sequence n=1 Tax=Paramecium tetraurelia TaxID=5888 RepID=Q6BGB1_PARTE|nr:hypothetical protein [Paramecium tetraurelia strain d4-2]XP_001423392.1 uncharacterized protein GSPATT00000429001 [Paramecium tetraurelia]CAH03309.1 hypothetical protein PTMB.111 [Paramecium tetraurelia]CAK55994.1 unnamed protein product [Paramecium tetraurelia]|eukprot:XP_001423392.1 hypothetical protein (macronuclear) [Paramecium tetraurelia strain d4-2]